MIITLFAEAAVPAAGPSIGDGIQLFSAIASLVGLPLTILGLLLAYRESRKAQAVSVAAQTAVSDFRRDLNLINTVSSFSEVLSVMQEIKRHLRGANWAPLLERLTDTRKLLIAIRESLSPSLSQEQKTVFLKALSLIASTERRIEEQLSGADGCVLNVPELNESISAHIDELQTFLMQIKSQIGIKSHE